MAMSRQAKARGWTDMDERAVFTDLFQQPGAYPYPFGSTDMATLYDLADADLARLPWPRLRDQAVAVDAVFEHWKGCYLALRGAIEKVGPLPALVALQRGDELSLGVVNFEFQIAENVPLLEVIGDGRSF